MKQRKYLILALLVICTANSYAQTSAKYYYSNWNEVSKEQAFYHTDFINENGSYKSISYWKNSGKKYSESSFTDSTFKRHTGIEKKYYESGKLLDSIMYSEKSGYQTFNEFSESGKLKTHAFYDEESHEMKGEIYDSAGNKLPGFFTFQKAAAFPGGADAWVSYLQKNLRSEVAAKHKAPQGNYTVVVSFLVDKNGKVIEVNAENDPGYGTAEEAVRVIEKSPYWIPAQQNNKPVIYRQRQSFTFQVSK